MRKVAARNRRKRPDSAALAVPKVKYVAHGVGSALLRDPLDGRTRVAKAAATYRAALVAHVNGEINVVRSELIDQAVRFALLSRMAWSNLVRKGINNGAAFDAYLKATRDQRAVLELIGLDARSKPQTLGEELTGVKA